MGYSTTRLSQKDFTISRDQISLGFDDMFYCIGEKDWYIDTKSDDKEFVLLFLHKKLVPVYPF